MWGEPLVEAAKKYRRWIGLLNMSNDDNNASVSLDENGNELFLSDFQPHELERINNARAFSARVLEAAGATQILWSGLATTHMQGSCRMGADPATSVVDTHGQSHEIRAPVRGRQLGAPPHAVGEPVADDHGARRAARRLPRFGRRRPAHGGSGTARGMTFPG